MAEMNDWDRIVIRSMQRACDGGPGSGPNPNGGSKVVPIRPPSKPVSPKLVSTLKGMLETLKSGHQPKGLPGFKTSSSLTHRPDGSKIPSGPPPKEQRAIEYEKTGHFGKAKKVSNVTQMPSKPGTTAKGERKAKAPAPREYKPSWKPFVGWDPSTWHGRGE